MTSEERDADYASAMLLIRRLQWFYFTVNTALFLMYNKDEPDPEVTMPLPYDVDTNMFNSFMRRLEETVYLPIHHVFTEHDVIFMPRNYE